MAKKTAPVPAKKAVAAKKPAAKKAPAASAGPNVVALTKAGVIPPRYARLKAADHAAIETLSPSEIEAIISSKTKLGRTFFKNHAAHGMLY